MKITNSKIKSFIASNMGIDEMKQRACSDIEREFRSMRYTRKELIKRLEEMGLLNKFEKEMEE